MVLLVLLCFLQVLLCFVSEPCRLFPSRIRISRRNQANMVQKVKVSELLYSHDLPNARHVKAQSL